MISPEAGHARLMQWSSIDQTAARVSSSMSFKWTKTAL